MKKHKIYTGVEIIDAGAKGKSIGKSGERVVLVDGTVPGDIVDVEVYKTKKGLSEGRALFFHKYSEKRVQPVCSHFYVCGGCTRQDMNYESQLYFKEKAVRDTMQRIAKLDKLPILPILPSSETEYYRNRLDFGFTNRRWVEKEEMDKGDQLDWNGVGFHVPGRFDKIFDIHRCYLQPDPSNQIRLALRDWALAHGYTFFDVRNRGGSLRSLIVRTSLAGEVMVIVIFYAETQERIQRMMEFLSARFPVISSLYYVVNPKANDTVYDLKHNLHSGKPWLTEVIYGISYRIGPKSFFQTNPRGAANLFKAAKEIAALTGEEIVYDLYTGVGSIALYVADKAKKVIGIETIDEAIEYAKGNANDNNITNTHFYAGDVKALLTDNIIMKEGKPDVIITDPPRTGMDLPVIEKLIELKAKRIVYVSCNPATQARDIELLKTVYDVKALQPVDMFPHTYHVENVALLELR
ncbi:MAG: 23S rRNA (uracil(1939)-C(5))-methyltransferase RlmD [Bacteroidota bacterium]|nr:23S rRNA (uracil(1939)-C(5))-methyltransferase RlmD [Bacteroidota bacterium]